MGILDALLGGLFGTEDDDKQEETVVERPCSNCPGYCRIAPDACSVCEPYKEQMIDALYWVEHRDELVSKYEVTGSGDTQTGAVRCPHCGASSEDPYVCEYCGSRLQDGNSKIRVSSAADIPNPVLEAQDIIFQRYEAVKEFPGADEAYGLADALSGVETEGLFSSIFNALMGSEDTNDSKTIGNKMSESEIEEMASFYGVSVADYLEGLDNGKYLTMSNKKTAAKAEDEYIREQQNSSQQGSGSSALSSMAGLAGMIGLGSMLFGGSSYNYSAARKPVRPKPTIVVKPVAPSNYGYTQVQGSHGQSVQNGNTIRPGQAKPGGMPARPDGIFQKPESSGHNTGTVQIKPSGALQKPVNSGHNTGTGQAKPSGIFQKPENNEHNAGTGQVRPSVLPKRPQNSGHNTGSGQARLGVLPKRPESSGHNTGSGQARPGALSKRPESSGKNQGVNHSSQPKQAEKISSQKNKIKAQEKIAKKTGNQTPKK